MKLAPYLRRFGTRFLLTAMVMLARPVAADDASAPAAAAPTAAPAGAWSVFSPPADDEVLAPQSRIKMLTAAKSFLERAKPDLLDHMKAAENPFYAKAPPPEPVATSTSSNNSPTPAEPAPPAKMSDEDKLRAIGDKLQPTGLLEAGQTRLVTLSGGGTLSVGQSFTATVPPDAAVLNISVVDADENQCVLKLNNTTLPISFVSKPVGGAHSPSSTSPSPSKP